MLSVDPVMEIIISSVLFKAFMKGAQNTSCNGKLRIKKPEISSVLGNFSPEIQPRHNSPGTPVERLSLKTTVILAFLFAVACLKFNVSRCYNFSSVEGANDLNENYLIMFSATVVLKHLNKWFSVVKLISMDAAILKLDVQDSFFYWYKTSRKY